MRSTVDWTTERSLFKAVTETTSLIAWATDEGGEAFYLSPEWFRFTGADVTEGPWIDWLSRVRPDERDEVEQAFALANERRVAFGLAYWLRRADGGYTRVWDVGLPKFGDARDFQGYFGTVCPLELSDNAPVAREETPNLTPREREVLKLVADGNTTGTVAAMLGISGRTVDMHVTNAVTKLGAFNRVHAVATALRRNEL